MTDLAKTLDQLEAAAAQSRKERADATCYAPVRVTLTPDQTDALVAQVLGLVERCEAAERKLAVKGLACEGCGLPSDKQVRTTNGGLYLCAQCLGDLNRKSPLLAAAESDRDQQRQRADAAERLHADRLDRAYEDGKAEAERRLGEANKLLVKEYDARKRAEADEAIRARKGGSPNA